MKLLIILPTDTSHLKRTIFTPLDPLHTSENYTLNCFQLLYSLLRTRKSYRHEARLSLISRLSRYINNPFSQ